EEILKTVAKSFLSIKMKLRYCSLNNGRGFNIKVQKNRFPPKRKPIYWGKRSLRATKTQTSNIVTMSLWKTQVRK
ncbi:hypothetical protein DOS75_02900, partial [Staphylococcus felis]